MNIPGNLIGSICDGNMSQEYSKFDGDNRRSEWDTMRFWEVFGGPDNIAILLISPMEMWIEQLI